ncbi:Uncharacterised protein [Campylobacter jejuni]|jgi:hypothetical protein|nr:Uncharacterised protein [Campylobacter jejuni]
MDVKLNASLLNKEYSFCAAASEVSYNKECNALQPQFYRTRLLSFL